MEIYQRGEEVRYDGSIHPLVAACPHYHLVPKEMDDHIEFRLRVRRLAARNPAAQQTLWNMCRDDPLFFLNTFLYLVEPREGEETKAGDLCSGVVPFNTWHNQDPVIAATAHHFGKRHMIGDKSRAQGASWYVEGLFLWKFIFRPFSILGMGSKDEETADDPNSPESLGWKLDFLIARLPRWMRPPGLTGDRAPHRSTGKSTWKNVLNGSFIKALASTKGIARAGRYLAFFLDESAFFLPGYDREAVANLVHTTNCLMMWSTPNGMDNEHYERIHPKKPTVWLRLVLAWEDNPKHARGLYSTKSGRLDIRDMDYEFPEGYEFILDGRLRSPWFDNMCEVMNWNYMLIDQELNRKYSSSVGRPFNDALIEQHTAYTMPAMHVGMLSHAYLEPSFYDLITWLPGEAYKFDLWCHLDGMDRPPEDRYTLGADISAGTAGETTSNSALEIFNSRCEQVGEFAANDIPPKEFAQFTVAAAYWFGRGNPSPLLIWERNGTCGMQYTTEIIRLQYPRLYYQKAGDDVRRYAKTLDSPGYHNNNRGTALDPLLGAMHRAAVVIRSAALLEECSQYVYDGRTMIHPKSRSTRDKSAANENHGDRVIAAAMAMRGYFEKPSQRTRPEMDTSQAPFHSIAGRMYQEEQLLRDAKRSGRNRRMCKW